MDMSILNVDTGTASQKAPASSQEALVFRGYYY